MRQILVLLILLLGQVAAWATGNLQILDEDNHPLDQLWPSQFIPPNDDIEWKFSSMGSVDCTLVIDADGWATADKDDEINDEHFTRGCPLASFTDADNIYWYDGDDDEEWTEETDALWYDDSTPENNTYNLADDEVILDIETVLQDGVSAGTELTAALFYFAYYDDEDGSTDGSYTNGNDIIYRADLKVIMDSFNAWENVTTCAVDFYFNTTIVAGEEVEGIIYSTSNCGWDAENIHTFADTLVAPLLGSSVLAITWITSIESQHTVIANDPLLDRDEDGTSNDDYPELSPGDILPAGSILDVDIVWNEPDWAFSVVSIEAIATHENGHLIGLCHSVIEEVTMYPTYSSALATLEDGDKATASFYYPDELTDPKFSNFYGTISGSITEPDGITPVFGAVVTAVNTTGDEVVCCYTDSDGNYTIPVPAGSYHVGISPLDGDRADPEQINEPIAYGVDTDGDGIIDKFVNTDFPQEWYTTDQNYEENLCSRGTGATAVTVTAGVNTPDIDFTIGIAPPEPDKVWEDEFGTQLLNMGDDDARYVSFTLDFTFSFYEVTYSGVWINSNGNLTFESANYDYSETVSEFKLEPTVSPLWDDLYPPSHGNIYYKQYPDRFIVTYYQLPEVGEYSAPYNTFQVILYGDGVISFGYNKVLCEDGIVGLSSRATDANSESNFSGIVGTQGAVTGSVYEEFSGGNDPFDLDGKNIFFAYNDSVGGFDVSWSRNPEITTSTLAKGLVGTTYSQQLLAKWGDEPYTWSLSSGSLPSGLSLSSSGVISGIPTEADTYNFQVQVTDDNAQTDTQNLSIEILEPDSIPPAAPVGLTAETVGTTVTLWWEKSSEVDFVGYWIYRTLTLGQNYQRLNSVLLTSNSYTDTATTTYYYVVVAVDLSGNESSYSNEVIGGVTPAAAAAGAGGGCLIATAAYGTPLSDEVRLLSQLKDKYLLTNQIGRGFVSLYYKVSPPLAKLLSKDENLRGVVRMGLKPLLWLGRLIEGEAG